MTVSYSKNLDVKSNIEYFLCHLGIADCPNLEDEMTCSYCPANSLYCGRGRACVKREMRCDGKFDCPDGSDEKDCRKFVTHYGSIYLFLAQCLLHILCKL